MYATPAQNRRLRLAGGRKPQREALASQEDFSLPPHPRSLQAHRNIVSPAPIPKDRRTLTQPTQPTPQLSGYVPPHRRSALHRSEHDPPHLPTARLIHPKRQPTVPPAEHAEQEGVAAWVPVTDGVRKGTTSGGTKQKGPNVENDKDAQVMEGEVAGEEKKFPLTMPKSADRPVAGQRSESASTSSKSGYMTAAEEQGEKYGHKQGSEKKEADDSIGEGSSEAGRMKEQGEGQQQLADQKLSKEKKKNKKKKKAAKSRATATEEPALAAEITSGGALPVADSPAVATSKRPWARDAWTKDVKQGMALPSETWNNIQKRRSEHRRQMSSTGSGMLKDERLRRGARVQLETADGRIPEPTAPEAQGFAATAKHADTAGPTLEAVAISSPVAKDQQAENGARKSETQKGGAEQTDFVDITITPPYNGEEDDGEESYEIMGMPTRYESEHNGTVRRWYRFFRH